MKVPKDRILPVKSSAKFDGGHLVYLCKTKCWYFLSTGGLRFYICVLWDDFKKGRINFEKYLPLERRKKMPFFLLICRQLNNVKFLDMAHEIFFSHFIWNLILIDQLFKKVIEEVWHLIIIKRVIFKNFVPPFYIFLFCCLRFLCFS